MSKAKVEKVKKSKPAAMKAEKKQELKRFSVESVSTFYEVHIVHAENEEQAKFLATQSDYNASKWLGQQISNVRVCEDADLIRLKEMDKYFFEGSATVDKDGNLYYVREDGSVMESMPLTKIL
jgi:hypothetical protein